MSDETRNPYNIFKFPASAFEFHIMSASFNNQVAIVTGGASGIGFAVAEKLHSLGARLALLDLNPDGLDAAKEIEGN